MTTTKYNQLIPDSTVDVFYEQIQRCIREGKPHEHLINNMKKLNNDQVPDHIEDMIEVELSRTINGQKEEELEELGFHRITNLNPNPKKVTYAFRNGGLILYPVFESNNDHTLYFEWECGRTPMKTKTQIKNLMSILGIN